MYVCIRCAQTPKGFLYIGIENRERYLFYWIFIIKYVPLTLDRFTIFVLRLQWVGFFFSFAFALALALAYFFHSLASLGNIEFPNQKCCKQFFFAGFVLSYIQFCIRILPFSLTDFKLINCFDWKFLSLYVASKSNLKLHFFFPSVGVVVIVAVVNYWCKMLFCAFSYA